MLEININIIQNRNRNKYSDQHYFHHLSQMNRDEHNISLNNNDYFHQLSTNEYSSDRNENNITTC